MSTIHNYGSDINNDNIIDNDDNHGIVGFLSSSSDEDSTITTDTNNNKNSNIKVTLIKGSILILSILVIIVVTLSYTNPTMINSTISMIKSNSLSGISAANKEDLTDADVTFVDVVVDPDSNVVVDGPPISEIKPNIVFILADDLGWNSMGDDDFDLSFATPVLSTLAENGIVMENYYSMEVCTPARASLLTGRHPLTIGMQYFMVETAIPWGLPLNETTIAEVLAENGYRTHLFGKWHLGHHSARHLPTARGFDTFTGFLNGEQYYWSKRNPDHPHFKDFMAMDRECYWPYDEDDIHTYSTWMYRDKAVETIEEHDATNPLFLFMSFQAVHDPFDDIQGVHEMGIPKEYIDEADIYEYINTKVKGTKRQQYAMSLYLMDSSINNLMDALYDKGVMDNTYFIFSSDNGGCYGGGGKNGPLRGTKGSLFEGGTKVDSFIYSPLIPVDYQGTSYKGLFHISDWFPTIIELTASTFTPSDGFMLDGVSHLQAWMGGSTTPRTNVLYNYYTNVDFYTFDMWVNGSFAVRDMQYKLMHTWNSSTYGAWYDTDDIDEDDDDLAADVRCAPQAGFGDGDFTYWLFDLVNDPYETTNLYYSDEGYIKTARETLYQLLPDYYLKSSLLEFPTRGNLAAFQRWKEHDDFIVPYVKEDDMANGYNTKTYPADCYRRRLEETNSNTIVTTIQSQQ